MSVELGKYAFAVLMSYGISVGLIAVLVGLSLARARRVRAALGKVEARAGKTAEPRNG